EGEGRRSVTRKFLENLDSDGDVVPEGEYPIEVVDARPIEGKTTMFLDLKVTGGPDAGRVTSVSVNVPDDDSSRGAIFHFRKKVRAFMKDIMDSGIFSLPDEEQVPALAELLIGKTAEAKLGVQKEGEYEGSQELQETRRLEQATQPGQTDASPASAPPTETPATTNDDVPF
ncbi:MAG: hypothetical protein ACRDHK_04690, partial [Actinomycetota bacterium]